MGKSEYVIGLYAILYGFNIALFMEGWIALFYRTSKYKLYWPYVGWTLACFMVLIQYWWAIYPIVDKFASKDIRHFIVFLIPILFQYVLTAIIFNKSVLKDEPDLYKYAFLNARKKKVERVQDRKLIIHTVAYKKPLFATAIGYNIYVTILNLSYGEKPSLIPILVRSAMIPLLLIGIYSTSEKYHKILAGILVLSVALITAYRFFQGE